MDDVIDESPLAPDGFADEAWNSEADPEFGESFHDPHKIVWVWIKDDRLTRVRLSNTWYTKLERQPGVRLDEVISRVLVRAHARVVEEVELPAPHAHGVELTPEFKRSLPRLNPENFRGIIRQFEELETRWERALEAREPEADPVVRGTAEGVTVTLSSGGLATRVECEEDWLDDASTGEITNAVVEAARRAYEAAFRVNLATRVGLAGSRPSDAPSIPGTRHLPVGRIRIRPITRIRLVMSHRVRLVMSHRIRPAMNHQVLRSRVSTRLRVLFLREARFRREAQYRPVALITRRIRTRSFRTPANGPSSPTRSSAHRARCAAATSAWSGRWTTATGAQSKRRHRGRRRPGVNSKRCETGS